MQRASKSVYACVPTQRQALAEEYSSRLKETCLLSLYVITERDILKNMRTGKKKGKRGKTEKTEKQKKSIGKTNRGRPSFAVPLPLIEN